MPSSPALATLPAAVGGARRHLIYLPDFRRLWLIGLVVFAVRWLEMLVVGIFVYQHTGSAFQVAMMTLLRMMPMVLFGPLIGALAERFERRHAQIVVSVTLLASAVVVAALAYLGILEVWHLAVASFANGVAWAADNPVRRVMIGEVVGPERMGSAMAIDVGANNASRMLGPTVGGLMLAHIGIAGAFSVSVAAYALALVAALRLQHRNAVAPAVGGAVLAHVIEGLLLARRDRRLVAILTVTIIYNVFGWPFTSMIPVIGQDSLHLAPGGIGVLASMDGIGSFIGAIAIALWARPAQFTRLYIGAVLSYLVLLMGFALAPQAYLAGAALMLTGLSQFRVQRDAGDADLPGGAARDAQPALRRLVAVYRLGPHVRLSASGDNGRADRRALGDGVERGRGIFGARRDVALGGGSSWLYRNEAGRA